MSQPESSSVRPAWLRQTKRLFPHPLFAGCISLASLAVGILLSGVALNVAGCWPMGIPGLLFFAGSFATACAAFVPSEEAASAGSVNVQASKPTFAVVALLIGVYSWLLTVAMHIFDAFPKNGPGSVKYSVTLGIAIAATLYTRLQGSRLIREHLGANGGRNLELTGRQCLCVVIFMVSGGTYLAWLMW